MLMICVVSIPHLPKGEIMYQPSKEYLKAKKSFKALPKFRKESKPERILRKCLESIPMEAKQRKKIGQPSSSIKTAERMLYDQPINKSASEEFSF